MACLKLYKNKISSTGILALCQKPGMDVFNSWSLSFTKCGEASSSATTAWQGESLRNQSF